MPEIIRVIRVIEYVGYREWVEKTLKNNYVKPGDGVQLGIGGLGARIREIAVSEPEVVSEKGW